MPYTAAPYAAVPASEGSASEREAKLLARERALLERERFLEDREHQIKTGMVKVNNWPFSCYAFLYHSIEEEVPLQHRSLCKKFYAVLFFTWLCLFWNWLTMLVIWGQDGGDGTDTASMWSTAYLACGIIGSWKLWYRSIYYALSTGSGARWVFFFINFLAHTGFGIVMALGIPSTAGGGIMVMLKEYSNSYDLSGMFALISMCLWMLNVAVCVYLLKKAHLVWKHSGAPEQTRHDVVVAVAHEVANHE